MEQDKFEEFQRESVIGFFYFLGNTIWRDLKRLWALIPIIFWQYRDSEYVYLALPVYVVFTIARAWLRYQHFQFKIDYENHDFVLKKGVFNKQLTNIPLKTIQNVLLEQDVVLRLLDLYKIKIDGVGSAEEEITINALKAHEAQDLKNILMQEAEVGEKYTEDDVLEPTKETIPLKSLIFSALFQNHIRTMLIVLAAFFGLYDKIKDFLDKKELESQTDYYWNIISNSGNLFIALFIILFFVSILVTLIIYLYKYYPTEILFQELSLSVNSGLIKRKIYQINKEKIQVFTSKSNYFLRKLNLYHVVFSQINESAKNRANNGTLVGLSEDNFNQVLDFSGFRFLYEEQLKPNISLLVRNLIFPMYIFIPIAVYIFFKPGPFQTTLYFILIFLLVFWWVMAFIGYKSIDYELSDIGIKTFGGAYQKTEMISMTEKIQVIEIKQKIWHRKRNIASVEVYTAGGELNFQYIDKERADSWVNRWLYQVEKQVFPNSSTSYGSTTNSQDSA